MADPGILTTLASDPRVIVLSSAASVISGVLTIYISFHLGTINRKIRFSALQEGWSRDLKALTSKISPLLADEIGNSGEIRDRLAEAKPILEAVSAHMSIMRRQRWIIAADAKRIGRLLKKETGAAGARRHYEQLIQTRQHLSEMIKQSKVFEAKV